MRAPAIALLLAAVCVLAGCSAPEPPPPPPDAAELQEFQERQNLEWWKAMFGDEEPPEVEVVELPEDITSVQREELVTSCIAEYDIEGFRDEGAFWSFDSQNIIVQGEFSRALWICSVTYPTAIVPTGAMSSDQLDWFYDFIVHRYEPCLASLGYELLGVPSKERFLADSLGFPIWFPWPEAITPAIPADDIERVELACPLPEMVDHLRA